jgi:folate-binding Fe-S cluster repair protein YgfZ
MVRKHTPYFHQFMALGAEMVDRIGFDSAFKFTSVENEHLATRTRAGLYDVYYQVLVDVKGADAEKLLQRVLVNDVGGMTDGKVLYSSMCNDKGGMIDDLTCFRLSSTHFWLCPTPSRVDHVTAYLTEQAAGRNAAVTNLGAGRAFISVQGPLSRKILAPALLQLCPRRGRRRSERHRLAHRLFRRARLRTLLSRRVFSLHVRRAARGREAIWDGALRPRRPTQRAYREALSAVWPRCR